MPPFDPFNKRLSDIAAPDLLPLRNVGEGWYIEYKSEMVSAASIAKSVSAFANHFGGWLFYGVAEPTTPNGDVTFPGIPSDQVTKALQRIRDAVAGHVSPLPHFGVQVVPGPCDSLGLAADRAIIVVLVEQGANPPFIHSTGRIYRRVADASDPKPENDRFVLDQLWERGRSARTKLTTFLERRPELAEGESNRPLLTLFLISDPLGDRGHRLNLNFDSFADIMSSAPGGSGIVFDNLFPTTDGYIARHVADNDPYYMVLTWEHRYDATSVLTMPIRSVSVDADEAVDPFWLYDQWDTFKALCESGRLGSARIIDANLLLTMIILALQRQHQLLIASGVQPHFHCKAALDGMWRCIPFLDMPSYMDHARTYGLPLIQESSCFAPPTTDPRAFSIADLPDEFDPSDQAPLIRPALDLFMYVVEAMGIPRSVFRAGDGEQLVEAGVRAIEAHKGRKPWDC